MLWRRRSCPTPPTTHDRPRAHGHHRYPRAPPRRTMFRSGVQPLQALVLALLAGVANGRFDFAPVAFEWVGGLRPAC
jgi:hypothetical protein